MADPAARGIQLRRRSWKRSAPSLEDGGPPVRDHRPSWPVEQVANLMPDARFELIEGVEHVIWFSHPNELESILRNFVDDTKRKELFF
jgi:hypothetical protein